MDIQSLKIDLIQWLTEIKDKSVLEKVKAIKDENGLDLSSEQLLELNDRLEKYELGEMKFKSWEETKTSVRRRSKNAT
ncbi:MAG: addiction module component [Cyclobacteriaceae bacterium]|nr:addiction module component [Cyclobacteriaceae bacterium]